MEPKVKLAFQEARLRRLLTRNKENQGACRKIRRNIRHLTAQL